MMRQLPPELRLDHVRMRVSDLNQALRFYVDRLKFNLLKLSDNQAVLGTSDQQLLAIEEDKEATRYRTDQHTGLYHMAFLLPSRKDLARFVQHMNIIQHPFGFADHGVSEAIYLDDPDGNGLEFYRDRPQHLWKTTDGIVEMVNDPIDFHDLRQELAGSNTAWLNVPTKTTLGHMHLRVGDITLAENFYKSILGFDVTWRFQGALFVSAGGYHHHIGLNTWSSAGATSQPPNALGLVDFTISLPSETEITHIKDRLTAVGMDYVAHSQGLTVHDPWQHSIHFNVSD